MCSFRLEKTDVIRAASPPFRKLYERATHVSMTQESSQAQHTTGRSAHDVLHIAAVTLQRVVEGGHNMRGDLLVQFH